MNFTESDLDKLSMVYRERLKNASQKLVNPSPTLVELQDWAQKENIDNPEVLELAIEKMGKGEKVEKKMS